MKKCSYCGCDNPDDSHFCGKCGKNVDARGHTWMIYNHTTHTAISDQKLAEYRQYEAEVNAHMFPKLGKLFRQLFDRVVKWWKDDGKAMLVCIFVGIVIVFLAGLISKGCSNTEKEISRIEVIGEYGIATSEDELIAMPIKSPGYVWSNSCLFATLNDGVCGINSEGFGGLSSNAV